MEEAKLNTYPMWNQMTLDNIMDEMPPSSPLKTKDDKYGLLHPYTMGCGEPLKGYVVNPC